MTVPAAADEPLDWRFKGVPVQWWGRTAAEIVAEGPRWSDDDAPGPVCVLRAEALTHNLKTMAAWCRQRGVELAPHGKTHMAPQLADRQLAAGACAITVATVAQAAVYRAFGVASLVLAGELVDRAGLAWVGAELDSDPQLTFTCWVDSVRGVELMTAGLAGTSRPVDVCVEVGIPGGRSGCRDRAEIDAVARAVAASPRLRLAGVAGYEAAVGQTLAPQEQDVVAEHLRLLRATAIGLAPLVQTESMMVSAGGSTYFDAVADALTGWAGDLPVCTVLRSGCYLTHDHGIYQRTSPLTRDGGDALRPAFEVRAAVVSRPEPELAVVAMGRRDVGFDQGLPVPLDLPRSALTTLYDQHANLRLGGFDSAEVGQWLRFGISHPCTVFDKWRLIPVLDAGDRVVDLIRTYF
ncbi:D-serine deaminase-like pyridoxal phosphate-dependent protein [Mycobacterium sp. BK558]|nr:D-serine deaminase-like pyridoxal phosphate-dependent protein [Mycobacterium sp. BK558]